MGTFPHTDQHITHAGNKYRVAIKDPKDRQEAYRQYCEHIASGLPKQAFYFDHPELDITWETMDVYIKENPKEFPPGKMKRAMAKRFKVWFEKGQKLVEGKYKSGSPVAWQTIMRNMFKDVGWDKFEARDVDSTMIAAQSSAFQLISFLQKKAGGALPNNAGCLSDQSTQHESIAPETADDRNGQF